MTFNSGLEDRWSRLIADGSRCLFYFEAPSNRSVMILQWDGVTDTRRDANGGSCRTIVQRVHRLQCFLGNGNRAPACSYNLRKCRHGMEMQHIKFLSQAPQILAAQMLTEVRNAPKIKRFRKAKAWLGRMS